MPAVFLARRAGHARRSAQQFVVFGHISDQGGNVCRLCLSSRVSKEHVPPKASGNGPREWSVHTAKNGRAFVERRRYQAGFFVRSACAPCNNGVLSQLAAAYSKYLQVVRASPPICDPDGRYLIASPEDATSFIRHVVWMILAIEPAGQFGGPNEALRAFVRGDIPTVDLPFTVRAFRVPQSPRAGTIQPLHARAFFLRDFAADPSFTQPGELYGGEVSHYPLGFVFGYQFSAGYRIDEMFDLSGWARGDRPERFMRLPLRLTGIDTINRMSTRRCGPEYGGI